jgi:hypothetical protein
MFYGLTCAAKVSAITHFFAPPVAGERKEFLLPPATAAGGFLIAQLLSELRGVKNMNFSNKAVHWDNR